MAKLRPGASNLDKKTYFRFGKKHGENFFYYFLANFHYSRPLTSSKVDECINPCSAKVPVLAAKPAITARNFKGGATTIHH